MIFVGLIGATVASCILDHTKKFKEVGVVALGLAILCLVWFMEVGVVFYFEPFHCDHIPGIYP